MSKTLWERELDALKLRYWQGESLDSLAAESGIHPDGLHEHFASKYTRRDIAATPDGYDLD